MGLFSNKKTQADGFSFAVDEVYALKEGKSVVAVSYTHLPAKPYVKPE